MQDTLKIAVVTPYYQPTEAMLRQCLDSVVAQTHPCTHICVADGHPASILDHAPNIMHAVLPRANRDFGNTPRFLGATLADSYGFDAIAFLDDDNWFEPNHLETMVAAHHATRAPLITSQRLFRHLDGSLLNATEPVEDQLRHVDTNCWLIFRPAFSLLAAWRVPRIASYFGDRIFFQNALRKRFRIATTKERTVNYRTKHGLHYSLAGIAPPPGTYPPDFQNTELARFKSPDTMIQLVDAIGFIPRFTG